MTHTYVILEISQSAYDEVAKKLREAKYDHAFHKTAGDRDVIDMHGIAVSGDGRAIDRLEEILQEMERGGVLVTESEMEKVEKNFPGYNDRLFYSVGKFSVDLIRHKMKETDE